MSSIKPIIKGSENKGVIADEFATNTAANWVKPGSGDAFDVNSTNSGALTVTTIAADTFSSQTEEEARAVLITGEDIGCVNLWAGVTFPGGSTSSDMAGLVFGYKSTVALEVLSAPLQLAQPAGTAFPTFRSKLYKELVLGADGHWRVSGVGDSTPPGPH